MKYFKIILLSFLILLVLGVAGTGFFFYKTLNKPNTKIVENVLIEVKAGELTASISADLTSAGVLANTKVFDLATKFFKVNIKPGFYEITPNMSMAEVINLLESGKTKVVKITFPEGWRTEQIAARLDDNKILKYEDFMFAALSYEGKLFPDTYYFNPRMTSADVVKMMLDNYNMKIGSLNVSDGDLVLASIVEREASKDEERPLIAGVYKNRIEIGMKLQADPTVQFGRDNNEIKNLALELQKEYKFWQPIKFADYTGVKSDSNTYQIAGLPPKPICNPGLKSIEAALNPMDHSYIYFLQYDGKIYPSSTLAQHDKYRHEVLGQ